MCNMMKTDLSIKRTTNMSEIIRRLSNFLLSENNTRSITLNPGYRISFFIYCCLMKLKMLIFFSFNFIVIDCEPEACNFIKKEILT